MQKQSDKFKQLTAEETTSLRQEQRNIAVVEISDHLRRTLTRKDRNSSTTQNRRKEGLGNR